MYSRRVVFTATPVPTGPHRRVDGPTPQGDLPVPYRVDGVWCYRDRRGPRGSQEGELHIRELDIDTVTFRIAEGSYCPRGLLTFLNIFICLYL